MINNQLIPLGHYFGHRQEEDGSLIIDAQNGIIKIFVVNQNTINIQVTKRNEDYYYSSCAVVRRDLQPIELTEDNNSVYFETEYTRVMIRKNPLRILFFSNHGALLNEDDSVFGISWLGNEITNYKYLRPGEHFMGLGEKAGTTDRLNSQHTNRTGSSDNSPRMNTSIPFYVGLTRGEAYGIFLDNSTKTDFNFGASNDRFSFFKAESGVLNYYFFTAPEMDGIIDAYTNLTGKIEMPPLWALGHQHHNAKYVNDAQILSLAQSLRYRKIPCDTLYIDERSMDGFKVFTWNGERFGNPHEVILKLKELGFKVVITLLPAIKIDGEYEVYKKGMKAGIFIKYPDKQTYWSEALPGPSHFPDFTSGTCRDWWDEPLEEYTKLGIEGFLTDMNEPTVKGDGIPDFISIDYDGQNTTYKEGRNVYGTQMAIATFAGAKYRLGSKRPFVISKTGFAGIQRSATMFTSGSKGTGEDLLQAVRSLINMGVSGIPHAGIDASGFDINTSPYLYMRWMQVGAFAPLFRSRTLLNGHDAEPWTFGDEAEETARNHIKLRYRLLPYTYSLMYKATQTGMPIARAMAFYHAADFNTQIFAYDYQNQFYYGPSILVCPIVHTEKFAEVYIPGMERRPTAFYDAYTDALFEEAGPTYVPVSKDRLPVFVKASSIILLQAPSQQQHTAEKQNMLEIHVYHGFNENTFEYYEDDGESYDYKENGFYKRSIIFSPQERTITLTAKTGNYATQYAALQVYFHGYRADDIKATVNNARENTNTVDYNFVDQVGNYEPPYRKPHENRAISQLPYIEFENNNDEIIIRY